MFRKGALLPHCQIEIRIVYAFKHTKSTSLKQKNGLNCIIFMTLVSSYDFSETMNDVCAHRLLLMPFHGFFLLVGVEIFYLVLPFFQWYSSELRSAHMPKVMFQFSTKSLKVHEGICGAPCQY